MKPIAKKILKGKSWTTGVLYCVSLGFVVGLGGISPAWAEKKTCPTTVSEWSDQAIEINDSYKNMQEALLENNASSPKLVLEKIRGFDRATTRWMQCLDAGTPVRAAVVRTQVMLFNGLVRSAQTCTFDPKVRCDEMFETINVDFSAIQRDDRILVLGSSFQDDAPAPRGFTAIDSFFDVFPSSF